MGIPSILGFLATSTLLPAPEGILKVGPGSRNWRWSTVTPTRCPPISPSVSLATTAPNWITGAKRHVDFRPVMSPDLWRGQGRQEGGEGWGKKAVRCCALGRWGLGLKHLQRSGQRPSSTGLRAPHRTIRNPAKHQKGELSQKGAECTR